MPLGMLGYLVAMAHKDAGVKGVGRKPDGEKVKKALAMIKEKANGTSENRI